MILALDGNVCTGKTTLQRMLVSFGFKAMDEYCAFINKIPDNCFPQQRYLFAESIRNSQLDFSQNTILDRSFISMCAHVWVQYRLGKEDLRASFLDDLCIKVSRKLVTLPDMFIHLRCSYQTLYARFLEREQSSCALGTLHELVEPAYVSEIDLFNSAWARVSPVPCRTIDTDCSIEAINVQTIASFVKETKRSDYASTLPAILQSVLQC